MSLLKKNFQDTTNDIGNFIYSKETKTVPCYGDIMVDGSDNAIMIDGHICTGCRRDFRGTQTQITTRILGIPFYRYKDFKPAEKQPL